MARDLAYSLLQVDPSKRPSGSEAINHLWFKNKLKIEFDVELAQHLSELVCNLCGCDRMITSRFIQSNKLTQPLNVCMTCGVK
jgi:serine/threonine protein kinase